MNTTKRTWIRTLCAAAAVTAVCGTAFAQGTPVKIGLLATLEGPFAAGGADGMRGAELALRQRGGMVAGRKIELVKASSNANPDVAVNAVRKLVEQDKVDIVVGPLSGGEGIAVKDYSKTQLRREKAPLEVEFEDYYFGEKMILNYFPYSFQCWSDV